MRLLLAYASVLGYIRRLWVIKSEVNRVFETRGDIYSASSIRLPWTGLSPQLLGSDFWTETFYCQYESVDYL